MGWETRKKHYICMSNKKRYKIWSYRTHDNSISDEIFLNAFKDIWNDEHYKWKILNISQRNQLRIVNNI